MGFARSRGSLEHDVQPLFQIVPGVEAGDHAPVEPAFLHQVDGPQVRLGVAQTRAFDEALDLGVHVTGVGVVDRKPDDLRVAHGRRRSLVEPFERVEQIGCVHLTQFAFGLGVDDHRASPSHVRVVIAAAHHPASSTAPSGIPPVVSWPDSRIGLMCEYRGEAIDRSDSEHAFSKRWAE